MDYGHTILRVQASNETNTQLIFSVQYAIYYAALDRFRIGGLCAGMLAMWCSAHAHRVHASVPQAWKYGLVVHLACWIGQFLGHAIFEKRAPALFRNLAQALMMAPIFVAFEVFFAMGYLPEVAEECERAAKENVAKLRADDEARQQKAL